MKNICFVSLMSILMIFPALARAGWFGGPKNYDECILESMKGVTSNTAANAIRHSCRERFPIKVRSLKDYELSLLERGIGKQNSQIFSTNVYNKNKDITITNISIRAEDANGESAVFSESVKIKPMEAANVIFYPFSFWVSSWTIISAKCYE